MKKFILAFMVFSSLGVSSMFANITGIQPYIVYTNNNSNNTVRSDLRYGSSDIQYNLQAGKYVTRKVHYGSAILYTIVYGTNLQNNLMVNIGGIPDSKIHQLAKWNYNGYSIYKHYLEGNTRNDARGTVFVLGSDNSGNYKISYDRWLRNP